MNYKKRPLCKTLVLAIVVLLFQNAFSQELSEQEKDSLTQVWKEKTVKELFSTFNTKLNFKDTLQTKMIADIALEKAKNGTNKEDYLTAYRCYGLLYLQTEDYHLGIEYMDKAIPYLKECPNYYNKTSLYVIRAISNKELGEYEKAIQDYLKGLEILQTEKKETFNQAYQISLRGNIATMMSIMYDTQEALKLHFKNLETLKNSTDDDVKNRYNSIYITTLINIAKAYSDLGDYKNGILYCNRVIEMAEKINDSISKSYGVIGLGNIYSLTGNYKLALQKLNEAESFFHLKNNLRVGIYLYKARSFYFLKDYKNTLLELEKAEVLKKKRNFDFFILQETYALFAKTYQAIGDIEKATYYFQEGLQVFKSNDERKSKIRKNISERYHLDKFTDEIESLSKKNNGLRKLLYILAGFLIVGILLFFIKFKKIQKINKKIFKQLLKKLNNSSDIEDAQSFAVNNVTDKKTKELIKNLFEFERNQEFLDNTISLITLANRLETNTTYLSKVINEHKNQSFSEYITNLRLQYVLERLRKDTIFRALTIDTIAKEVGFNNIVSFIKAFKEKTQLTPYYYIKELKKEELS